MSVSPPAPVTVRPPPGTSVIVPLKTSAPVTLSISMVSPRTTVLLASPDRSLMVVEAAVTPLTSRVDPVRVMLLKAIEPEPAMASVPAFTAVAPV